MITYLGLNILLCCKTEVTLVFSRLSCNNIVLCCEYMLEECICHSNIAITIKIRCSVPFNVIQEDLFDGDLIYLCRQITPMRSVRPCVVARSYSKIPDEFMNPFKFPLRNFISWRFFAPLTWTWNS